VNQCRRAGIGVIVVSHVDHEIVNVSKGSATVEVERATVVATQKFMRRIFPPCDFSVFMQTAPTKIVTKIPRKITVGGKSRTQTKREQTEGLETAFLFRHKDLQRFLSQRTSAGIMLPDRIVAGDDGGWAAWSGAYESACNPESE
jgi:hypothetical protein